MNLIEYRCKVCKKTSVYYGITGVYTEPRCLKRECPARVGVTKW